ncbi:MAG: hypothetical protein Q7R39_18005 [Dehalococcoidia bacterium]|nr:hypothetical protein [Dehalococcoidia bacterium]
MNVIGILMAFMLFGLVIAIGAFLVVNNLSALYRRRALHISAVHTAGTYSVRDLAAVMSRMVLLMAGIAMVYQGGLWIYIVVFR